ncbi:RNA polymerase II transcription factor B subunit 2 [Smittium mucronatum]|uniref:RNA polymerase II transcription factor B subunit 2 n=1 Tax=Smittium mucronatum TaxID=133383 RepID=A0A1R0GWQ1_9FUNG|nr:RNA polymerase II transcription factor B subunit 2 [Smittium mucronatum]
MADQNQSESEESHFQITILEFLEKLPEQLTNRLYRKPTSCLAVFSGDRENFELLNDMHYNSTEETEEIDDYANEKWESVLHFMVGTSEKKDHPNKSVLQLLRKSGLVTNSNGENQISSKGFQFLLQDICSQIWIILLQYLNMQEDGESDIVSVLGLFFQLGSLEFGRKYRVQNMTDLENRVFKDLTELGFIYKLKDGSHSFIPTRLVSILTGASNTSIRATIAMLNSRNNSKNNQNILSNSTQYSEVDVKDSGFIILETNYRLYAYTDSILQISIMSLFTQMVYRFPNMVVGSITRDSIRRALSKGINADQIVTYLTMHAHPQVREKVPPVPITVSDQIRLWELEKNRINPTLSFLYHEFNRQQDFDTVHKYALQLDVVLWVDEKRRTIVIKAEGHEPVKEFVKRRMSSKSSNSSIGNTSTANHK